MKTYLAVLTIFLASFATSRVLADCRLLESGKTYRVNYEIKAYENNQFTAFNEPETYRDGDKAQIVRIYTNGVIAIQRVSKPEAVIQYDDRGNPVGCSVRSSILGRIGYVKSRDCSALD